MSEPKKPNINNIEQRSLQMPLKRMEGDSNGMEGVACVMEQRYNMGWYDEIVHAGAFDNALKNSDIRCLLNHKNDNLLGRTKSGTLKVWVEGNELRYKIDNRPKTTLGNDVSEMLARGDLAESSFQFTIKRQRWETIQHGDNYNDWEEIRHIDEIELVYDVAPVTFPANPDTSVAKRSFEQYKQDKIDKNDRRQLDNLKLRIRL